MKTKFILIFFLILFFSFSIRFYHLTENPEGFEQTEAAFGYNAYSVLKTGRDEYGKLFPLILVSVGDYKLSGYMYWEIPFVVLFGLSEFSMRLSAVVASMISLLLVYFIVQNIMKNTKISLLALFFTGITPWHLILSRMAYDPIVAFMFYLISVSFFIQWHKKQRIFYLLISSLGMCMGILTYYSVWVLFPFTFILYAISIITKKNRKTPLWQTVILLLLPVLMVGKLLMATQGQRLYQDSTFQTHALPLLMEQIREDQSKFSLAFTRIFHNKLIFYPQFLLQNLSNNLSFDFLFLRGDKVDRRFYVPHQGVLYILTAPFILLGILYFWKNHRVYKNLILLGSISVIFIGSSFSELGSEMERTIFAVPAFSFLTAYGLITVYKTIHNYFLSVVFAGCIGILLIINSMYFNHQYFWHGNIHEPWGRYYGVGNMLSSLPALEKKYNKIVIPDNSYIFFYFYNKTDPQIAWREAKKRLSKTNFIGLNIRSQIGNYLTMPLECPAAGKLNVLYVCLGTKIPKNSKIVKIFRYRDGQPAYTLLEFTRDVSSSPPPFNLNYMNTYGTIPDNSIDYWKEELETVLTQ